MQEEITFLQKVDIFNFIENAFEHFLQYVEASDRDGEFAKIEINVNILTMGHWPTYPVMDVVVPAQLGRIQDVCGRFYASKHNGRKLQWQYSLASAILKATFKPGVIAVEKSEKTKFEKRRFVFHNFL